MQQRVMIAIALACDPSWLIADEPTTALDATIQAQIMKLIIELNNATGMGVLLITHDLALVAETCSRVVGMYLGQVVEEADAAVLFSDPAHPYTRGLIQSIPHIAGERPKRLFMIEGTVPLLDQIPRGCRFSPRCLHALDRCREETPDLRPLGGSRKIRCWFSPGV
jgi:oligopeptide/dipeptide ABC transporter ATP-binding protein